VERQKFDALARAHVEAGRGLNTAVILKKSGSNFSWAFWGLEKSRKEALLALYAFCRTVDDIVDQAKDAMAAQTELNRWRGILDRLSSPSVFDPPIARDLAIATQKFPIQSEDLYWIIDGVESDLMKKRYATFTDLLNYCDSVASAVGLATLAILNADRKSTYDYAFHTGRALQMTNILRDVGSDARLGRIYIPQEDLERFGYTERELLLSKYNDKFVRLMEHQRDRTLEFYRGAENALPAAERKRYPAAELMRKLYFALLRQIEAKRFNVFPTKVRVPRSKKLAIALSVWFPHFLRTK
jgi:15-cis-phytoene synthase